MVPTCRLSGWPFLAPLAGSVAFELVPRMFLENPALGREALAEQLAPRALDPERPSEWGGPHPSRSIHLNFGASDLHPSFARPLFRHELDKHST